MVVLSHHHPQLAVHAVPRPNSPTGPVGQIQIQHATKHHCEDKENMEKYGKMVRRKKGCAKLLQALRVDSWFRLQRGEPGPGSEAVLRASPSLAVCTQSIDMERK